jgi:glycosyltransferase involved in cell wall biosynthesis
MRRLAIVVSHPIQYYSPWFRWMQANTDLEFKVFYLWNFGVTAQRDVQFGTTFKWDVDLLDGYESEFVPNVAPDPGTHHFKGLDNPELIPRLEAWRPDCVLIFGYNWLALQRAIWWAKRQRIPALFRGDSHLLGRGQLPLTRRILLRFLYRKFAAFLYTGTANRDYFAKLGVPSAKLFFAPHSVDASRFTADPDGTRTAAERLRRSLGIADKRVVVFAGKLNERKQPIPLLHAFIQVATPNDALVFVGDGPDKAQLEATAAAHPATHVRFLPFANQSEMPTIYAMADVFTLPSRGHYETWGLAINEAMHLGVPCLVSDVVGCQQDLVVPGETGWVFNSNDPAELATTLKHALQSPPAERARLTQAVLDRISGYTYRQTTDGLLAALASLPTR